MPPNRDVERRFREIERAVARFQKAGKVTPSGGGVRLTIRDDARGNTRGLDRVFAGLEAVVDAFPDALRDAVPEIRLAHRAVFSSEGSLGRGAWPELAPRTLADRRRLGYPPGPILLRAGDLRNHVLGTPARITRMRGGWVLRIAPKREVDGVPKYRALARGNPSTNLPPRPMVAIGPAAANRITSRISRYLRRVAEARGL